MLCSKQSYKNGTIITVLYEVRDTGKPLAQGLKTRKMAEPGMPSVLTTAIKHLEQLI